MTEDRAETEKMDAESPLDSAPEHDASPAPPAEAVVAAEDDPVLAAARDAALQYAAQYQYDYGPDWRDRELEWEVVGTERAGEVTRVTLEYRPPGRLRGSPGSEWIEVDAEGRVKHRHQIKTPTTPVTLLTRLLALAALLSVLSAGALVPFLIFNESGGNPFHRAGRIIEIIAKPPVVRDVIQFQGTATDGTAQNWQIVPLTEGAQLAAVEVTVINRDSGAARLIVDEEAAELRTEDNVIHKAVDSVERSMPVADIVEANLIPGFVPLWLTVDLVSGEQITGMVVFEVPRGSEFRDFRWMATDTIVVRY